MLSVLLAASLASPSACPVDLTLARPRLRIVRAAVRGYVHEIVTVDVVNRGIRAQQAGLQQRLELVIAGAVAGSQPIPSLGPQEREALAFRRELPRERHRTPVAMTFRYVPDRRHPEDDCDRANDLLTVTL